MSFSKIVFAAAVLSIFTATAFAEETETESDSEWDKILSAGIQVAGSKFYYKDASDDYNYITTDGFGCYTQYMSINKNNGFGFLLNGSLTIFVTDDLGHDNDIGTLRICIVAGGNADRITESSGLNDIQGLTVRLLLVDIDQENFGSKSLK